MTTARVATTPPQAPPSTPAPTIPSRHPDGPCKIPIGLRLVGPLLGLRKPDRELFRHLGELLTIGDEPADRLVEWMHTAGMARSRPLFERALVNGIDSIDDAPAPLREFFTEVETVPTWVDRDLIEKGARVMRSGGADGLYVARDVALLGGYHSRRARTHGSPRPPSGPPTSSPKTVCCHRESVTGRRCASA